MNSRWSWVLGGSLWFALSLGLVWPALWNGYPLLFPDSGHYLFGSEHWFHPLRPIGYGVLIRAARELHGSLWSVVVLQSAVTAGLLLRIGWLSLACTKRPWLWIGLHALAVVLMTGLPKYSSWVMADVTAAWPFLAAALCLLSSRSWERFLACTVLAVSVPCHVTTLTSSVGGLLALPVLVAVLGRPSRVALRLPMVWLAAALMLGVTLSLVLGHVAERRREGPAPTWMFLVGRLHASGALLDVLDRRCPELSWQICERRGLLRRGGPDWLLWGGDARPPVIRAFIRTDNWRRHRELVMSAITCCWPSLVWSTLTGAARTLAMDDSTYGLNKVHTSTLTTVWELLPGDMPALLAGRQYLGQLTVSRPLPGDESTWNLVFLLASLIVGVLAYRRGDRAIALAVLALWLLFVLNAFVIAAGSWPLPRYHGRLAWLAPAVCLLGATRLWAGRHVGTAEATTEIPRHV